MAKSIRNVKSIKSSSVFRTFYQKFEGRFEDTERLYSYNDIFVGDRKNARFSKVRIAEIRIINFFIRQFSSDLKILFELAKVRITRVRSRHS